MIGDRQATAKLLVVDAGNTRCKYAYGIPDSNSLGNDFPNESVQSVALPEIESYFGELADIGLCIVSSVSDEASNAIRNGLASAHPDVKPVFLTALNSSFNLNVDQPEILGPDRIAAAIGAYARTQSQTIVIDSGTATTIDWIDKEGIFQGGVIFPGVQLALNSLSNQTARLPQLQFDWNEEPTVVGRNTNEAMHGGVFWSLVGGVELIVSRLRQEFGLAKVLVTGGNGESILMASSIESATYVPSLVLEGLWRVGSRRSEYAE